ncbi:MAG: glycolate oxidase subunit GlcE [Thiothrix sp.]|uniref:glycolate oxidase subunit GlcE n=1 Tax=Thiothrix sp. TaxID=1032 RepID=UPI0026366753|nr:glycolate oxidase subunit GlcE [Thiothrix sp.]MDD5392943.1 glycolate oxidase subunit GlcE [Thiothrix sp.]
MIANNDITQDLHEQVLIALDRQQPLTLVGGNSKAFYGNETKAAALHTAQHSGIVAYEPSELAVTVRAGTRVQALEALLAANGQMLAFEPPCLSDASTIGGAVAAGLSGPARPWLGAVRDHVLGARVVTGHGKIASFGGQVMKNVAGYDVSRLMAGSLGTLALILDVSLKTVPKLAAEITLALEMPEADALELGVRLRQDAMPLTASCYFEECLYLRLSGASSTVRSATRTIGGEILPNPEQFWRALRNQTHEFFQQFDRPLWRLSFPPATQQISRLEGNSLIEWSGAQRWIYSNIPVNLIRSIAEKHKGHATLYRGRLPGVSTFHPQPHPLLNMQKRLKQALDPQGIFNPGRLNKDW